MSKKLIYGVGVNDSDYKVNPTVKGKRVKCPFYMKWRNMIARCYSSAYHKIKPSYKGCVVCSEWLSFSNFKSWMIKQDWKGKQLDKDIVKLGNKEYSPSTCVFVSNSVNCAMRPITTNSPLIKGKIENLKCLYLKEKDERVKEGILTHLNSLILRITNKDS